MLQFKNGIERPSILRPPQTLKNFSVKTPYFLMIYFYAYRPFPYLFIQ